MHKIDSPRSASADTARPFSKTGEILLRIDRGNKFPARREGGRGIGGVDYAPISRLKRPRRVPVGPTWSPLSIRSLGIGRFDDGAVEVVADLDNDIGLIADPFKNPGGNLRDKFIRRRDSRTRLLAKAILIPWDENVR